MDLNLSDELFGLFFKPLQLEVDMHHTPLSQLYRQNEKHIHTSHTDNTDHTNVKYRCFVLLCNLIKT